MGKKHMGCTCFDLLEDIGTTAGTRITVFTSAPENFQVELREDVTPEDVVLKVIRANRNMNICCEHIIAIEARPPGGVMPT